MMKTDICKGSDGRSFSLRADMRTLAKTDPRWKRALAAYDLVPTKPKAKAWPKAKSGVRATPGVMSVEAFTALDPEMAAQFGFTSKPAVDHAVVGNVMYLGAPAPTSAKPPSTATGSARGPRLEGNLFYLGEVPERGAR